MTFEKSTQHELVSALIDGQLQDAAYAQALTLLESSEQARADWHSYHLVGDFLRHGAVAPGGVRDEKFLSAVFSRLKLEGNEAQPRLVAMREHGGASSRATSGLGMQSANQAKFYWKLVAAVASFAFLATAGWQLIDGARGASAAPQLAAADTNFTQAQTQTMIRDPELDKLLQAHQFRGAVSAFQLPADFMRNATFDKSAR